MKFVDVDLLPTSTTVISTGQMSFAFYQAEPVTDKVRPRYFEVALWVDGEPVSDIHELKCDLTSENPRDREQKLRLVLSKQADNYNGEPITLELEEPIKGTNQFKKFKSMQFTLRRAFKSDFD